MSRWTHVAGLIRIDSVSRQLAGVDWVPLLQHELTRCELPSGSEGPIEFRIADVADENSMSGVASHMWRSPGLWGERGCREHPEVAQESVLEGSGSPPLLGQARLRAGGGYGREQQLRLPLLWRRWLAATGGRCVNSEAIEEEIRTCNGCGASRLCRPYNGLWLCVTGPSRCFKRRKKQEVKHRVGKPRRHP